MEAAAAGTLSSARGVVLYVGALLGPGLLLLPGLAASIAGPASILAWAGLLVLSGLLAVVFAGLGVAYPSSAGVRFYTAAGLGQRAGRGVGWCFLAGIITGAPIVCLIGGSYLSALLGGGGWAAAGAGGALLVLVLALTACGVRASATVQLVLVGLLVVVVTVAVAGSAGHARFSNWSPFAPHGWTAVGSAGSALMLSFVGWEAIAPLSVRFADPRRQLPRVIAAAFSLTVVIYLSTAAVTVAALGARAATTVPLASLLTLAVGSVGTAIAAVAAVLLTLGTTNAYLAGAAALLGSLATARTPVDPAAPVSGQADRREPPGFPGWLLAAILTCGCGMITLTELVDVSDLVSVPSTLFLVVYLGCTIAGCRLLHGCARAASVFSGMAVAVILTFSTWALLPAVVVAGAAVLLGERSTARPVSTRISSHPLRRTVLARSSERRRGSGRARRGPHARDGARFQFRPEEPENETRASDPEIERPGQSGSGGRI